MYRDNPLKDSKLFYITRLNVLSSLKGPNCVFQIRCEKYSNCSLKNPNLILVNLQTLSKYNPTLSYLRHTTHPNFGIAGRTVGCLLGISTGTEQEWSGLSLHVLAFYGSKFLLLYVLFYLRISLRVLSVVV